jgi:hypothetical protein
MKIYYLVLMTLTIMHLNAMQVPLSPDPVRKEKKRSPSHPDGVEYVQVTVTKNPQQSQSKTK